MLQLVSEPTSWTIETAHLQDASYMHGVVMNACSVSAMMYECMSIPPPPHQRASPQPSRQVCAYDCLVYVLLLCLWFFLRSLV